MVVDQILNRFTAMLLGEVKLHAYILFDVVVLYMGLGSVGGEEWSNLAGTNLMQ